MREPVQRVQLPDGIVYKCKSLYWCVCVCVCAVSYTHLDVYKRQDLSYGNQTTASIHSRIQKIILVLNPLTMFVPCDNHSLNLVRVQQLM